jgi:NAD-dependent deacetylase
VSQASDSDLIKRSVELLSYAHCAVALTGAGISTPSGIPDFRSRTSGLWSQFDPFEVASLSAFRTQPDRVFAWVKPLLEKILAAKPNPAHLALARLEAVRHLSGIITQNIDDLHGRAGSRTVFEIHGNLRFATCTNCYTKVAAGTLLEAFIERGVIPYCSTCGRLLKPDIVLFGEQLPFEVVFEAEKLLADCDLVLVIGSSLEVSPAASMPVEALNRGARLIIINNEPTYLDERAEVVFHADVVDTLPCIADEVINARNR